MFKQEYHYLVAGLPDLVLEQGVKKLDFHALREEVYEGVFEEDQTYIRELFSAQNVEKGQDIEETLENWLQFYQQIENISKNRFIRSWFQFDNLLRNIQSAWMCRKLGKPVQTQLVGHVEEIEFFVKNNLPDFGLRHEIPLGEQIFNLLDESENLNILEREFRFDQIRWKMADELTIFNYFDIDKILAFLAKIDILDRWLKLDKERGTMLFDGFVKNLVEQKNVKI
ncbi:MAG: DUF2764 domain-containing protein [Bacteroidales bacterium]|jgi:hypothetical protein|nr:DUF2764 domain-containing protein [Bacteroidales bacterium]